MNSSAFGQIRVVWQRMEAHRRSCTVDQPSNCTMLVMLSTALCAEGVRLSYCERFLSAVAQQCERLSKG